MTSVKSETESIDETGLVIIKDEPLATTDESTADYDSVSDMKWKMEWLEEPSGETASDTHLEDDANSIRSQRAKKKASTASEESNISNKSQLDEPPNDSDSDWIPEPHIPKCHICSKEFSRNSSLKVNIFIKLTNL